MRRPGRFLFGLTAKAAPKALDRRFGLPSLGGHIEPGRGELTLRLRHGHARSLLDEVFARFFDQVAPELVSGGRHQPSSSFQSTPRSFANKRWTARLRRLAAA